MRCPEPPARDNGRPPQGVRRIPAVLAVTAVLLAVAASPAAGAAPASDNRSTPQQLGALPVAVPGTTGEATLEGDEPPSLCGVAIKASVWFALTATSTRAVLAALDANGDMDAVVDVYARQRSQLNPVDCTLTNARGEATVDWDATAGTSYLVRVAARANSVTDAFSLRVLTPDFPARPPGRALRAHGVVGTVDRFANPDDAWAVSLRAGRTYRVNMVTSGSGCAQLSLHGPGARSFGDPLRTARCDAHVVFVPPKNGRYTLLVAAPRASRRQMHYRLRVGLAGPDDSAPGVQLRNDVRVRGALHGGGLDALDLYRFSVLRRSDVSITLRTGHDFTVSLLSDQGRRLSGATTDIERRMKPGHYFLAVRAVDGAHGGYVLRRLTRTITRAATLVDGRRHVAVAPGRRVVLSLRLSPSVSGGRTTLLVERFDPIDGWLFAARFHPSVVGGRASVGFRPASVGRWRVTGEYAGTRTASGSSGGTARVRVVEPLAP
jgi:hypothetical protein